MEADTETTDQESQQPSKTSFASNQQADFLIGAGEMGALISSIDWSDSPLGPLEQWPASLRTALSMGMTSPAPIIVWWGRAMHQFYNDAYRPVLGTSKHPQAMGAKGAEIWPEIWHIMGPIFDEVFLGHPVHKQNQFMFLDRNGYQEETYFTHAHSPIRDQSGQIVGVFTVVSETTEQIIRDRRLKLLNRLTTSTTGTKTVKETIIQSIQALQENSYDLPFVLFYLLDSKQQTASLLQSTGLLTKAGTELENIDLAVPSQQHILAPVFRQVIQQKQAQLVKDLTSLQAYLPEGPGCIKPSQALVLSVLPSVTTSTTLQTTGLLVIGINPHRILDEEYRSFLDLITSQITNAIANAAAYEEERQRAEALAELDRAKTTFFSNVSHEFRTPLTLMLAPLEDALALSNSMEELHQYIATAYRNALRLQKLVNTLLDFSRIEAGRAQANFEPIDLSAYTTDLASTFRSIIEKAGIHFIVDIQPFQDYVFIDRDMWEKIVLNLLSNAFKFTFEGSITVRLREKSDQIYLEISDTGTGIAEQEIPHIFERFHRIEGVRSRTYEGSGIGLALVKELVRLHGGNITLQSTLHQGTTFTVTIPKGSAHLSAHHINTLRNTSQVVLDSRPFVEEALSWLPTDASASVNELKPDLPSYRNPTNKPRIVLVDDNADMRIYVSKLLAAQFEVQTVANGREALAVIAQSIPDLVITDIMMPEVDGFALLKHLKNDIRTARIPVIMLSARAGEEATMEGITAGADVYLVKPFSARELITRVTNLIASTQSRLETERRLYHLFMQAPAMIAILRGPDHVYELANPLYIEISGKKDIVGKKVREVFPELAGQMYYDLLDRVYQTGQPFIGTEMPIAYNRRGQLETAYFNFVYQPLRNLDDQIDAILVYAIEVTDHVQARQAVQRSEEQLRLLTEAMPQLVWTANAEGEVEYYNRRWYDYTGTDLLTASGHKWTLVVHPDELPETYARWTKSIQTGEPYSMEYRLRNAEGDYRWFLGRSVPVHDKAGQVIKWLGTCTDIHEQRLALDQKDEFIGMASHELKTPITSIKAYTQILRRIGRQQPEKAALYLERMEVQIDRLTRLIVELLDVARIQKGKLALQKSSFDFDKLIKETIETIQLTTTTHTIELELEAPVQFRGDRDRLGQVIVNLVSNAIKYSPHAHRVTVSTFADNEQVRLQVQDYGVGIPLDHQTKIFDRFHRVYGANDKTFPGLGIGLYIVADIVKRHDGTISVYSKEGKGTLFTCVFPLHTQNS